MITYFVGDSLIRIKNAAAARHKSVSMRNSKFVRAVLGSMERLGFVRDIAVSEDTREVSVKIVYHKKEPRLMDLKLVSSPGLHVYMDKRQLSARKKSTTLILSTSHGILSDKEAIKQGVGGEVIVEIN